MTQRSILSRNHARETVQVFIRALKSCLQHPASSPTDFAGFSQRTSDKIQSRVHHPQPARLNGSAGEYNGLTTHERDLVEVLSKITRLHSSHFSPDNTIHQLGIDSIGAIQLASKLRLASGIKITAADILEKPRISEIALLIEQKGSIQTNLASFDFQGFERQHKPSICLELALSLDDVESILPCTPLQMGLVSQFIRSEAMYVNYVTYEMDSTWTADNLEAAWKAVSEAHIMLRTGFVSLQDPHVSFAMVSYSADMCVVPIQILRQKDLSDFDIDKWRRISAIHFHERLSQPPWAVVVVDNGPRLHMHIAMLHALYDAHSLNIILDDLITARTPNEEMATAAIQPTLSYILNSSVLPQSKEGTEERIRYWKDAFSNALTNKFPNFNPLQTSTGNTEVQSRKGSKTVEELEKLCQKAGISLQAAGQAAWAQLLSALIGEQNVTFGVVLSGRDSVTASERAAFPCLTTVPVPVELPKKNRELLDAMMKFNASIRRHQFTPTKDIQRWAERPSEALFDTIFAFQKLSGLARPKPWKVIDEVASSEVYVFPRTIGSYLTFFKYAISLELEPQSEELIIRATFLSDVIPKEQAQILLAQFDALLVNLVASPDANGYDAFTDNANLFSITAAKQPTLPSPVQLLHHFVESQAQASPGRIAFEFAHEIVGTSARIHTWTYDELNEEGNRISNLLLHRGAIPGDLIAICFDKCPEASFGILGILKAGCAYVALDPEAPPARRAFIVEDSQARLLLTSDRNANRFADSEIKIPILYLDERNRDVYPKFSPVLPFKTSPQSVCYCLYTSGTTGTPKGCEITHENAVQAMRSFSRLFSGRWSQHSKWLQFASFHFDVSVLEQYWTWSEGLCVVSAPRDLIFEDLARTIRVLGITHIDLTPSLASLLHPDDVPSLCQGVFITGGEQLKQEILDVWGSVECIHNGYGPTEATIGVTMCTRVPRNGKPANIGPQFDNVGSYVLHPGTQTPVLRGGVGELCVSGKLVGKGYLNRPDLTKEKFPFVEKFKERIYRTGDLVRILHDGSFIFLGRADDQVKLRGQRLELSEIDTTIKRGVLNIKDVATYVLKHPKQQREQLITFFVVAGSSQRKSQPAVLQNSSITSTIEQAREVCRAHLPGYMVPTHFIPMNKMPLSANNKTETKVLKKLFEDMSADTLQSICTSSERSGELSEKEAKVAGILRKFVQVNEADLLSSSSIFELGLDSISVIGFTRALKNAGFHSAQASKVMRLSTIKALASSLTSDGNNLQDKEAILATQQMIAACNHRHRSRTAKVLKVTSSDIESIAPCTPLQQGMISKTLESDDPMYFASFRYRLAANVQLDQLKSAWVTTLEHLQILRTRFIQTDEGHVQAVLRTAPLPWFDVSVTEKQNISALLDQRLETLCNSNSSDILYPFEIAIVESPSQSVLALNIFHGLYDGNSLPILLSVVQKQYMGHKNINYGPPFHAVLPHGPLHSAKGAKAFWTQRVAGQSESINIHPSNEKIASKGPTKSSTMLQDLHTLSKRCKELNVTHQAVVQACWVSVLRQHYNHAVSLGVVTSGRSIDFEDAEKVIGPMFNTIPFQIELSGDDTWQSIAKKCQEFNVSALPYQHTPLRDIQKWCKVKVNQQIFNNLFVFQKETKETVSASKNEVWTSLEDESFPDFPLAFEAELKIDKILQVTLVAQSHVADQETLQRLATLFEHAMTALLENPEGQIKEVIGEVNGYPATSSPDEMRGMQDSPVNGLKTFQWTKEALLLRQEIARLAAVDESAVTPDVSVFELGLDSIDVIKLSSRLVKHSIQIPVSSIMRNPTISTMVEAMSATQETASEQHASMLDEFETKLTSHFQKDNLLTQEAESVLPATPLQEAMVAEMLNSHFTHYYNHDVLKLSSSTEIERLKKAWQLVYETSPILRTSIKPVSDIALESSFAQVILRPREVHWVESQHSSEAEVHASLEEISGSISSSSSDNTYFRLTFATTPIDRFLIISIPHALYDGYSINLLHNDVFGAYKNKSVEPRPSIRPVLEDIVQASTSEAQSFWSSYLSEAKSCLISDSPSAHQGQVIVHRQEQISKVPVETFRKFCKSQGITLQALGQACWSLVLASYVHKLEIVYGVVLSGRDTEESQQVMFPTMNTIAFRAYLHGTGSEMLRYTQENMSNIRQFQHFPLRRAQAFADTGGEKLFNTLFIYQTRPRNDREPDAPLYESVGGASEVEFSVCVEMEILERELIWRVACTSQIFDDKDTEVLINKLESMAHGLIENSDSEVVSFKGEQVCIGELPPFTIATEVSGSTANSTGNNKNENHTKPELSRTEKKVRSLLSTVSKVPEDDIYQHSTLFHLGLDSISAIKVSALLRKQGINISVSNMLRAPTLEGISRFADQKQTNESAFGTAAALSLIPPFESDTTRLLQDSGLKDGLCESDIDLVIPASAGQVFMLSHWQNSGGGLFFPEFPVLRSRDMKSTEIISAWRRFVRSHSILRSIFITTGQKDSPYAQVFLKFDEEVPSQVIENDLSDSDISLSALDFVRTSKTSLDWMQPFVSLSIHKLTNGEWQLGLKIHHALYDGVSITSLISELRSLIESQSQSTASTSNDPWRAFISEAYSSRQSDTAKEFWTSYLSSVIKPNQTQMVSSEDQRQRVARYKPKLIEDATPLLRLAQKQGLSLPTIFFSIYARLYHSLQETSANPEDVLIGIYIANRSSSIAGLEMLSTVNLLPLRIDTTLPVLKSAKQIQEDLARVSDAQNVSTGLWQIYEWTGVKVGTFVNWLRLPESSTEKATEAAQVMDAEATSEAEEERDEINECGSGDFVIPRELQGSDGVREAYIVSIVPAQRFCSIKFANFQ
jgi:amino acid adenylation domain-containing protein